MPASGEKGADPVEWWLCSHLVSIVVSDSDPMANPALLEEISTAGVRFVLDTPLVETTTVVLQAGHIERRITVEQCRVREDDFQIEARFADGYQWTPDAWMPDHLYRPGRKPAAKGAGAS